MPDDNDAIIQARATLTAALIQHGVGADITSVAPNPQGVELQTARLKKLKELVDKLMNEVIHQ